MSMCVYLSTFLTYLKNVQENSVKDARILFILQYFKHLCIIHYETLCRSESSVLSSHIDLKDSIKICVSQCDTSEK